MSDPKLRVRLTLFYSVTILYYHTQFYSQNMCCFLSVSDLLINVIPLLKGAVRVKQHVIDAGMLGSGETSVVVAGHICGVPVRQVDDCGANI